MKEAAAAYLQAQYELVTAAREAHNDGVAVTETHTSWLRIPAEQAAIEARIQTGQEDAQAQQVDDAAARSWTRCAPPATSQPSTSKTSTTKAGAAPRPSSGIPPGHVITGRTYLERGRPVAVLIQ